MDKMIEKFRPLARDTRPPDNFKQVHLAFIQVQDKINEIISALQEKEYIGKSDCCNAGLEWKEDETYGWFVCKKCLKRCNYKPLKPNDEVGEFIRTNCSRYLIEEAYAYSIAEALLTHFKISRRT